MNRHGRRAGPLAVAAIAAASVTLLGCGSSSTHTTATPASASGTPAGSAPQQSITLHFLNSQPAGTFDAAIKSFEAAHPGITVINETVPSAQMNPVVLSRLGSKDSTIDIFTADEPRIPSFAKRGFLADLSAAKPQLDAAVLPQAADEVTWDSKIYAMPLWTSTGFLYYDKKILSRAGIDDPSSDPSQPLTWEQVVTDASKAKAAGSKLGIVWEQPGVYYQIQPLVESAGGGPGLTGEGLLTPDLANQGWVKAMQWYGNLYRDGLSPRGVPSTQAPQLFESGQTAFYVGTSFNLKTFLATSGLNFGVAPLPYFVGGKVATPTDSWSIGVSAYGKHQAESTAFAEYLSLDPTGSAEASSSTFLFPVNKSAFTQNLQKIEAQGGEHLTNYSKIVDYQLNNTAVHRPRTVGYVDFETAIDKTISDIVNGAAAQSSLTTANSTVKRALAQDS